VQDYYSLFDVFCLPSLFEGLPVVGIEAQASGLPLLVSDTVARQLDLTGNVTYLPIGAGADAWVRTLSSMEIRRDSSAAERLREKGYDITAAAKALQDWYLSESERSEAK